MRPFTNPNAQWRPAVLGQRIAVALFSLVLSTAAADWPQYRGPTHDGVCTEKILTQWPANGLRQIWKAPLTDGFSSFAVGQGLAVTMVKRSVEGADREVCVALDAQTGQERWAVPLGIAKYEKGGDTGTPANNGGDGPRSTPSIDGGRVYATTAQLGLYCLDAASGRQIWSRDLVRQNGGQNIGWENAASPLIDGDLLFVMGGGAGQALLGIDKHDGHVVWKGEDDPITHATPVVVTLLGVRQVIFFTQKGLVGVERATGQVLWRYRFPYSVSSAASPVVGGDIVYCSCGYGVGAGAARISRIGNQFTATGLWRLPAKTLNSHWSTPVYKDGCLYGLFGFKKFGTCPFQCVELATGRIVWSKDGFGPGGCVRVGDQVLVLGDAGELVLTQATPRGYTELARTKALTGKCWSTPAISNGHLYIRSTKEGVCLDISPGRVAHR
ncbi:MAG: PQQ-binding-like beta-propeller repeat protein [Verrucomicrobia bacterium]|nr:PQQ-binding-like beta-propeller repeat protein [Verrucomicrobiota bacterium]